MPLRITRNNVSSPPSGVPDTFTDGKPLPKVLIFDLDYTLWPTWVDTHVSPPLRPAGANKKGNTAGSVADDAAGSVAVDASGSKYSFYPGVAAVLGACAAANVQLAAASRTHAPDIARDMLRILTVQGRPAGALFADLQIFPGDKVTHMNKISQKLRIEYAQMVFFDDESRNRNVERALGVHFVLVDNGGVNAGVVDAGIRSWRRARGLESATASAAGGIGNDSD